MSRVCRYRESGMCFDWLAQRALHFEPLEQHPAYQPDRLLRGMKMVEYAACVEHHGQRWWLLLEAKSSCPEEGVAGFGGFIRDIVQKFEDALLFWWQQGRSYQQGYRPGDGIRFILVVRQLPDADMNRLRDCLIERVRPWRLKLLNGQRLPESSLVVLNERQARQRQLIV